MTALATMPLAECLAMLAQSSAWASAYLLCLIVGGGFLLFSAVFGGHGDADADFDLDGGGFDVDAGGVDLDAGDVDLAVDGADLDVGAGDADAGGDTAADVHHGADWLSLSDWLSFRFIVYFMATFGAIGTILTHLSDMGRAGTAVASVVSGVVVGQGVQRLFRRLQKGSDSSLRRDDFIHRQGRVTVAIAAGRKGEVALDIAESERFLPAVCQRMSDGFAVGDQVVVVAYEAGTAKVVSRQEYEFLHGDESGETG